MRKLSLIIHSIMNQQLDHRRNSEQMIYQENCRKPFFPNLPFI